MIVAEEMITFLENYKEDKEEELCDKELKKIEEMKNELKTKSFKTYYHVTSSANITSILKNGLKTGMSEYGVSMENQATIFLWGSKRKAKNFQRKMFKDVNIDSVILEIFLPNEKVFETVDSIYKKEYLIKEDISPYNIIIDSCPLIMLYEEKGNSSNKTIDYSFIPDSFEIEMFTGETGTGKTYKIINDNIPSHFLIAVPTRQLAYEIFMDYKDTISNISTGEVHINKNINENTVVVFENLNRQLIDIHDVLIIDEAHFLADEERGGLLLENIIYALSKNKKVVFATATNTLSKNFMKKLHIKETVLKPFVKITKEEKSFSDMKELAKNLPTLVFTKYAPDEDMVEFYCKSFGIDKDKADYMSANIPSSERIKKQIAFKNGDIQLMIASNVLAQGVNFPAVCVLIEYNEYDTWELIQQKIGRAGRPFLSDKAFFALNYVPEKETREIFKKYFTNQVYFYRDIYVGKLNLKQHEVPTYLTEYVGFKYSKKLLTYLVENGLANKQEEKAYKYLIEEESKVHKILTTNSENHRNSPNTKGVK